MNPLIMCDRRCRKGGFKYFEIAATLVEDDGKLHNTPLHEVVRLEASGTARTEFPRQLTGLLGRKGVREQDVGALRDQKVVGEEIAERGGSSLANW